MKLQTPTKTLKVRDFNDMLSCRLCNGYLINPTTVDNCLHTYCRSCIVQHLQRETCCPQCSKHINATNLKSDNVLRTLIYKLIPGLYQKERERAIQFKAIATTPRNAAHEEQSTGKQVAGAGAGDGAAASGEDEMQDIIIVEENFFAPTEPISLSLEYHPALLKDCSTSQIPPVRYLQCPAGLKIRHLKRFLCSKFDIDPECKRIEVEVIYEDEVLPNDFTLMDVGYCYNWTRNAPMKFTYRILFYDYDNQKQEDYNKTDNEIKRGESDASVTNSTETKQIKALATTCDDTNITTLTTTNCLLPPPPPPPPPAPASHQPNNGRAQCTASTKIKQKLHKVGKDTTASNKASAKISSSAPEEFVAPVKMIIARKTTVDSGNKKLSPKYNNNSGGGGEEVTYTVTNDFKSLRSNDMRYSDYAVSSTTSNSNSNSPKRNATAQRSPKSGDVIVLDAPNSPARQSETAVVSKCDILVSIPQSQLPKTPYSVDDEFENVSLAQLKTASKKSPPTGAGVMEKTLKSGSGSARNVPKLKIELNSLKTRLSISKPKSAGVLHQSSNVVHREAEKQRGGAAGERIRQRKLSLDEVAAPLTDHLDLATYAKNIGLQPIEVLTPPEDPPANEKLKYSPNASPLSSASSASTTSSSNNAFPLGGGGNELTTTTSFHKKRKKKHSKDSKEAKESKRRRMHAEISSKPEEESLKMKVKITAPHNHKSYKSSSSENGGAGTKQKSNEDGGRNHKQKHTTTEASRDVVREAAMRAGNGSGGSAAVVGGAAAAAAAAANAISQSATIMDNLMALNKALGEESRSISNLMKESTAERPQNANATGGVKIVKADETLAQSIAAAGSSSAAPSSAQFHSLPKHMIAVKDTKLPASPPLPPSLFKTTPLNFNTLNVSSTATPAAQTSKQTASKQTESAAGKVTKILPKPSPPTPHAQYNRASQNISSSSSSTTPKSQPNFIVPNLPRRAAPHGTNAQHSAPYTPSSIASASSKQIGLQLKRSASLDEPFGGAVSGAKQPKLDVAQRKALYNSYASKSFTPSTSSALKSVQSSGVTHSAITITQARSAAGEVASAAAAATTTMQAMPQWQLPPYTQLHIPFNSNNNNNKPAVEIVRINSQQSVVDIKLPPTPTAPRLGGGPNRMMGPPLSTAAKAKKPSTNTAGGTTSVAGTMKSTTAPLAFSASKTAVGVQGRNNINYQSSSPPGLVNLQSSSFASKKIGSGAVADSNNKKPEMNADKSSAAKEKQLQKQQRNSLRDFRPVREVSTEIIEITDSPTKDGAKDEQVRRLAETTTLSSGTGCGSGAARDSLEATLKKIKQNITSTTTLQETAAAAKQQSTDDLQNLHLLSESATAREKIAIRAAAAQSYEKPKLQQATLVRQQNASVRNIPNPSALAFRNMQTTPLSAAVVSSTPTATSAAKVGGITSTSTSATTKATPIISTSASSANASTTTTPAVVASNTPTQIKPALTSLTTLAAPHSPVNNTTTTSSSTTTGSGSRSSPTNSNTTAVTARSIKKPTTIDQVAANLNMRASAAAAEANAAAKLNAAEDVAAQMSSSTTTTTTTGAAAKLQSNNMHELKKVTTTAPATKQQQSATTSSTAPSSKVVASSTSMKSGVALVTNVVAVAPAKVQQNNSGAGTGSEATDIKAKVLPKSAADGGGGMATKPIVTDVVNIKNVTNNNNNNENINNNKNSNNSNSRERSNSNGKRSVTATSVTASD